MVLKTKAVQTALKRTPNLDRTSTEIRAATVRERIMGAFPLPNGRGSDFLALIPYIFATPSLRTIGELIQRAELSIAALAKTEKIMYCTFGV